MVGRPFWQTTPTGSVGDANFFLAFHVTFEEEVTFGMLKRKLLTTVYLFSFNSGRVARRSGPLFFLIFFETLKKEVT